MINKYSNKHNQVKNTNWREADQLAINKRSREVKLGTAENNISSRSERDLNPGPADFKSGALTTRPRSLPFLEKKVKNLGKQERHLIVMVTLRWCWFHQPNWSPMWLRLPQRQGRSNKVTIMRPSKEEWMYLDWAWLRRTINDIKKLFCFPNRVGCCSWLFSCCLSWVHVFQRKFGIQLTQDAKKKDKRMKKLGMIILWEKSTVG